jgi:hypothetical protein
VVLGEEPPPSPSPDEEPIEVMSDEAPLDAEIVGEPPSPPSAGLSSDWGPTLHAAARRIGAVVALIYTLGFMAGESWHQLVAWAQKHQLHGLARLGLPGGNLKAGLAGSAPDQFPDPTEMVTTPVGPKPVATANGAELMPTPKATPVTTPANVAPPSIRRLAAQGCSQREIAGTLGLTRYQIRKALAA